MLTQKFFNHIKKFFNKVKSKMIKVGVGIFVYNDKNQVLIGKRLNSIGHGTLALPGGHLEHHQSFENVI